LFGSLCLQTEVKLWIQTQRTSRLYCSGAHPGFIAPRANSSLTAKLIEDSLDSVAVRIDSKGRIVLPASIRKSLGLESGEVLRLEYDIFSGNKLQLKRGKEE
jgi:AbrB family looped-hinge helix DNA binding protein